MASLKLPLPIGRAVSKNTKGNQFFDFLNTYQNAPREGNFSDTICGI